jgi:hypothetical protein
MSSTATVCTIIIMRTVMQRWANKIETESNPFEAATRDYRKEVKTSVVAAHHKRLQQSRPVRCVNAE